MDGLVPEEYRNLKTTPLEVDTSVQPFDIKVKKPVGGAKSRAGRSGFSSGLPSGIPPQRRP